MTIIGIIICIVVIFWILDSYVKTSVKIEEEQRYKACKNLGLSPLELDEFESLLKRHNVSSTSNKARFDYYLAQFKLSKGISNNHTLQGNNISNKEKSNPTKPIKLEHRTKDETLISMSRNIECPPEKVKINFVRKLHEKKLTARETNKLINKLNEDIITESFQLGLVPESTASALMKEWVIEFLENKEYRNRIRTKNELLDDFKYENNLHNKSPSEIKNAFKSNLELSENLREEMSMMTKPAERFHRKAVELMVHKEDYLSAIQEINKGLTIDDLETSPWLHFNMSDCNIKLIHYQEALNNINKSIGIMQQHFPNNFRAINRFLEKRSEIKELLNDYKGSKLDKKLSEEFYQKYLEINGDEDDW